MDKDVEKTPSNNAGSNPETRSTVRRTSQDRRNEIRFEADKENRRKNKGRRSSDIDYWGS